MSEAIVVGVDGSESALAAVRWAAAEAARHRLPVKLVHAWQMPVRGYPEIVLVGHDVREALRDAGCARLRAAEQAVRLAEPEVEVVEDLVVGQPAEALIAESGHARLVVVGSRGLGGVPGLLAGSVAVALSTHGECPVVVVREPAPARGAVVVGVDGSPVSDEAVAFAFEQAAVRGTPLTALMAWTDFLVDGARGSRLTVDWAQVEDEHRRLLAERLAGWSEKYPDVSVTRIVVRDRPVRALVEAARDAQLLVIGSHGVGGVRGMLLGSTSQALIHCAPCPLAVVRGVTR